MHVAIVTAAGYPGAPERFEQRVEGLLAAFRQLNLSKSITDRWGVGGWVGGWWWADNGWRAAVQAWQCLLPLLYPAAVA